MNSIKRANNALTHAQIVNEYESKVRALERDNLNQAMQARKARKELEDLLLQFDDTLDILGEYSNAGGL